MREGFIIACLWLTEEFILRRIAQAELGRNLADIQSRRVFEDMSRNFNQAQNPQIVDKCGVLLITRALKPLLE